MPAALVTTPTGSIAKITSPLVLPYTFKNPSNFFGFSL